MRSRSLQLEPPAAQGSAQAALLSGAENCMCCHSQTFVDLLHSRGQRWVPILDPCIHIRKGYAPYDTGIAQDVFIKDVSGEPYVGQVGLGALYIVLASPRASVLGVRAAIRMTISATHDGCVCVFLQLWPGATHWPDFLNPTTKSWWLSQIKARAPPDPSIARTHTLPRQQASASAACLTHA